MAIKKTKTNKKGSTRPQPNETLILMSAISFGSTLPVFLLFLSVSGGEGGFGALGLLIYGLFALLLVGPIFLLIFCFLFRWVMRRLADELVRVICWLLIALSVVMVAFMVISHTSEVASVRKSEIVRIHDERTINFEVYEPNKLPEGYKRVLYDRIEVSNWRVASKMFIVHLHILVTTQARIKTYQHFALLNMKSSENTIRPQIVGRRSLENPLQSLLVMKLAKIKKVRVSM